MSEAGRYPGQRALRITARTVHLVSMALVVGGAVFDEIGTTWLAVLVVSGGAIVADDVYKYGDDWFRFAQSWAVLTKLILMAIALAFPQVAVGMLIAAVVVGSVISHAPGKIRQAALWGPPGPCATKHDAPSTNR